MIVFPYSDFCSSILASQNIPSKVSIVVVCSSSSFVVYICDRPDASAI